MATLKNIFMLNYLNQVGRTAYVANNLLNLIDKIEKIYSDDELQSIKSIIRENILLENSNRTPRFIEIQTIKGCIYNLDTWLVENNINFNQ
ncbi:hypothetical protein ACKUSY_09365 [Myroides odoratus]